VKGLEEKVEKYFARAATLSAMAIDGAPTGILNYENEFAKKQQD